MNKAEQANINGYCQYEFDKAMEELKGEYNYGLYPSTRLNKCQADVIVTENYFILRSYSTIVAVIVKDGKKLIDVLRHEYGYKVTSAQHITKFAKIYGAEEKYTWRYV